MFESFTNDEKALRVYRSSLKGLRPRLVAQASFDKVRDFVPSTFDSMMVDFGRRVERRELYSQIEEEQNQLADTVPTNDEKVEREKAARIARLLA